MSALVSPRACVLKTIRLVLEAFICSTKAFRSVEPSLVVTIPYLVPLQQADKSLFARNKLSVTCIRYPASQPYPSSSSTSILLEQSPSTKRHSKLPPHSASIASAFDPVHYGDTDTEHSTCQSQLASTTLVLGRFFAQHHSSTAVATTLPVHASAFSLVLPLFVHRKTSLSSDQQTSGQREGVMMHSPITWHRNEYILKDSRRDQACCASLEAAGKISDARPSTERRKRR